MGERLKGFRDYTDYLTSYPEVSPLSVGLWLCLIPTRRVKKTRITSFILDLLKIIGRKPLNLNK
jgi:hypothetical protein